MQQESHSPINTAEIKVTLYNSDHTVNLEEVIKPLFEQTRFCFNVSQVYFPVQQKAIAAQLELETDPESIAVLVLNAHESRLSINEQNAGIGYRLIYQALLKNTGNRVLVVIAHDEKTSYTKNGPLIADWIKSAISYQFSPEQLNGAKGFVFSWNERPTTLHKHALEHFCSHLPGEGLPFSIESVLEPEPIQPNPVIHSTAAPRTSTVAENLPTRQISSGVDTAAQSSRNYRGYVEVNGELLQWNPPLTEGVIPLVYLDFIKSNSGRSRRTLQVSFVDGKFLYEELPQNTRNLSSDTRIPNSQTEQMIGDPSRLQTTSKGYHGYVVLQAGNLHWNPPLPQGAIPDVYIEAIRDSCASKPILVQYDGTNFSYAEKKPGSDCVSMAVLSITTSFAKLRKKSQVIQLIVYNMGNKHTTHVRIVDNTDKVRAEREAELRIREEIRRKQEEEEARLANQILNEKLAKIDADVAQLKEYKLGSLIPGVFHGLDVSDVVKLRVALFGPTGSGKSSFVNTMERVLRRTGRGTCNPQDQGGEGTIILEEFLGDFFFRLLDTRGFFEYDTDDIEGFLAILNGWIRDGEIIERGEDGEQQRKSAAKRVINISEKVHACILVVSATDPRLNNDSLVTHLSIPRKYLKENGITAVTLVTHEDEIAADKKDAVLAAASRATGSPGNQTFFIANYIKDDCPRNPRTEEQAIKILQYALVAAERSVKISKQRQSYQQK